MSAVHFAVGNACNNGCLGCIWTRRLDVLTAVRKEPEPAALDWNTVAHAWEDVSAAARGS